MTRTTFEWQWAVALALTAATFGASALLSPNLPATVPTHWNLQGEVDGYGQKSWALFLMPMMTLVLIGFFRILPVLSPKNFEVDAFRTTYLFIMLSVVGLLAFMHGVILYATWSKVQGAGRSFDMGRMLVGGISLFLALAGNVVGKVRRNFFIGVRTPWTLANDRVWNDTHRIAAWVWFAGGLASLAVATLNLPLLIAIGVLTLAVLFPAVYSFLHYKTLERQGAL